MLVQTQSLTKHRFFAFPPPKLQPRASEREPERAPTLCWSKARTDYVSGLGAGLTFSSRLAGLTLISLLAWHLQRVKDLLIKSTIFYLFFCQSCCLLLLLLLLRFRQAICLAPCCCLSLVNHGSASKATLYSDVIAWLLAGGKATGS